MIIIAIGDIVGRAGRKAFADMMPTLQKTYQPDLVVVNAENAAAGFGITSKIAAELFAVGADALTLGNHTWDNPDGLDVIAKDARIVRPINVAPIYPGQGHCTLSVRGRKTLLVNVSGRVGMAPMYDCPYAAIDRVLPHAHHPQHHGYDAVLVDVHAEATSEKAGIAYYIDGKASAVWGTHTHVPTADTRILKGGTAFQSDLGMTGDYDSVIGMRPDTVIPRMRGVIPRPRMETANGAGTVCGVAIAIKDATGLAAAVCAFRIGGVLPPSLPLLPQPLGA